MPVSSLVAQLAQGASLNSNILSQRRKHSKSYLFTEKEADQHDLESIHALGVNGLLQLSSLDHSLRAYEQALFSDAVKDVDRTLLSADADAELSKNIAGFLTKLGPHLLEPPTGKVIEWLVKRFRIHDFNVEDTLALFLPYHESPHFAKMLTILHIKEQSTWSFLLPFKSAAQCVPRVSLVVEMSKNSDVARFITSLLPDAIRGGYTHHTLLAFNAACLHDFIVHSKTLDEGTLAFLLPALLEPLLSRSSEVEPSPKDSILGSYILLSALSQRCPLAPKALRTIITAMANCARRVSPQQFVNAALIVCEPQDELDSFSDATVKSVLRLSGIVAELQTAVVWVGIEKFICPMLSGLEKRLSDDTAFSLAKSLVTSPNVPNVIVRRVITSLMRQAINLQDPPTATSAVRQLLSATHQRHPAILQEVGETLSLEGDEVRVPVEQLLISFSITYPNDIPTGASGNSEILDFIVGSTSADVLVRVNAVNNLINTLATNSELEVSDLDSVHSALLTRVQDTSTQVLDALYTNPVLVIPIFSRNSETFIAHLVSSLCSAGSKPARALLRTHFTFLASHFCPTVEPSVVGELFHKIFFPFMLFSKPRQRTAETVWETISDSEAAGGLGKYELLGGCACLWKETNNTNLVEKMGALNLALASKIAGNILISNNFSTHFDSLLEKLGDTDTHVRLFGSLITRALLCCLSGRNQTDAAYKVLQALNLAQVDGQGTDLDDLTSDTNLAKLLVLKPNSAGTCRCLQTSIVAMMTEIPLPMNVLVDWFAISPSDPEDGGAYHYVELMRSIYTVANSAMAPLSTHLLGALFTNFKDDALAFLAGIWTNHPDNEVRVTALRHAAAFLESHISEEQSIDFQTVLPSLFVALHALDVRGKEAALECLSRLVSLTDTKFSTVYGFDTIYGEGSAKLQYLDRDDYRKYVMTLAEHKEYLTSDSNYIIMFHKQHLGQSKSDKKKEAEYKIRVLCYLLSHVDATSSPDAQLAILRSIRDVSDQVKAQILLPVMQMLVQDSPSKEKLAARYGSRLEEFTSLLLSSFDQSISDSLNEPDCNLWPIFILSLEHCFRSGSLLLPRDTLVDSLKRGLFASLSLEHKLEVCNVVLKMAIQDLRMHQECKNLLTSVLKEGPFIVQLLTSLQLATNTSTPRANKRARLTASPEDPLSCLTLVAEVLSTKPLPGSLDLISRLLETLGSVVQYPYQAQADIGYLEQLLMSAVENAADNVAEAPNLTPSAIRLDVLVELIRVTNNPQTFHQALLLMANLSRLAPDSVLHNVMPVFTFMGSNVFHRDDSYSFRVVQMTIDSIVPVMVSSLKIANTDRLALYIAARDFLRIFTHAANHIPRHRRTNFFAHLVDVLGPQDFLTPVLMLLLEKTVNRVIGKTSEDIQGSLSLQISILQHYSTPLQLFILTELLRESRRLVSHARDPKDLTSTFLEVIPDDEHTPPSTLFKRRAQALVVLVEYALRSSSPPLPTDSISEGGGVADLVALLIDIATLHSSLNAEDTLSQAARSCLGQGVSVMSAVDFVGALLVMLESEEDQIKATALDLLTDRLPDVSDKFHLEMTPTLEKILTCIRKIIPLHPEGPLPHSAYKAMKTIVVTTLPGRESSLVELIPVVLTSIKCRKVTTSAMAVLPPLIRKVGPRVIPHFREIVSQCVLVLRETGPNESLITDEASNVLRSLLNSIPTFWNTEELTQVINLYVYQCASVHSVAMPTLMKAVAKQAPAKALLQTLCEVWPAVRTSHGGSVYRCMGYFHLLTKSLRSAARSAVLEQLRSLSKIFLEAFEVSLSQDEVEDGTISSFLALVVKLNETSFRPLFRRLHDWAFVAETDDSDRKKIVFCHVYISLLDYFKELMTPYMSFMLGPFIDILKGYSNLLEDDKALWSTVIDCLSKSFAFDEGAFWRDEKLRQITSVVIDQVTVCLKLNDSDGKTKLSNCLSAMTACANDDSLLKSINLDLLMYTRSEDARLRSFVLTCSEMLWRAHGSKLLGFVSETTSFIAECAEDENDSVVKQSHKLKDAVESVAGSLNGL